MNIKNITYKSLHICAIVNLVGYMEKALTDFHMGFIANFGIAQMGF